MSLIVTDLFNNMLLFDEGRYAGCPRWIPVRIVSTGEETLVAHRDAPDDEHTRSVLLKDCACGGWYAVRASVKREEPHRCRACDRKALSDAQRERRQRKRQRRLKPACVRCGVALEAERTTKRYCSPACRVAAHRSAPPAVAEGRVSDKRPSSPWQGG